jgi:hypothetical protein
MDRIAAVLQSAASAGIEVLAGLLSVSIKGQHAAGIEVWPISRAGIK